MARASLGSPPKRVFLALPLASLFADAAEPFLQRAREEMPEVKWVKPESIHITLHFFGLLTEAEISGIIPAAADFFSAREKFSLSLGGIGFFPSPQKIKVIWGSLHGGADAVENLQRGLEDILNGLGYPSEKRSFKPHVTLGRTRAPLLNFPAELSLEKSGPRECKEAVLFESRLLQSGSVYEVLQRFPFSGR